MGPPPPTHHKLEQQNNHWTVTLPASTRTPMSHWQACRICELHLVGDNEHDDPALVSSFNKIWKHAPPTLAWMVFVFSSTVYVPV
jgi:hypothetical protein